MKFMTAALTCLSLGRCATLAEKPSTQSQNTQPTIQVLVEKEDTLASIADQFGTSWKEIYRLNKLVLKDGLVVGQVLAIQPGASFHVSQKRMTAALDRPTAKKEDVTTSGATISQKELNTSENHLEGDLPEDALGMEWIGRGSSKSPMIEQMHEQAFSWPVNGSVSSYFGQRGRKFHKGIDIRGSIGTPIHAAMSGQVLFTRKLRGYGNTVVVDHGSFLSLYAHCSRFSVRAGQSVEEGATIAAVGTTGNARGPHLHFEIRGKDRRPVDPFPMLSRKIAELYESWKKDGSEKLFAKLLNNPELLFQPRSS